MYRDDPPQVTISNMITRSRQTLSSATILLFTIFVLLVVVGCSGEEPTLEPASPPITATEAVQQSRDAMRNLESFSFQLTHESGHTTLSGALELTRAGGLVATNGLDLEAEANIGRAFVRVEAVVIGEQTWMTNPLTGVWSEIAPEDSPFSFLDPVKLVADILGDTLDAEYSTEGTLDGQFIISGKIPANSLATLVGSVDPSAMPELVLSLDAETKVLKQVSITGIVQPEDEEGTIRVITLSEFDKKVSLEPPI